MPTMTISIDVEAYERLRRARQEPSESFSSVIKRAAWPKPPNTAGELLKALDGAPVLGEYLLRRLEEGQVTDAPPSSRWETG